MHFIAILSIPLAIAQAPDYFANNPEWLQSSSCRIFTDCIETSYFVYYLKGDSSIAGKNYKKVHKRGESHKSWSNNPPVPSNCQGTETYDQPAALLRQEEKKIYIYTSDNSEKLLYDFDLNVGDTLPETYNQWESKNAVVTEIDSIVIDNDYRKVFKISGQSLWAEKLIEGIGSNKGLLEPMNDIFDCGHCLACFAVQDTVYFPTFNSSCDFTVDVNRKSEKAQIKIFPNPVKDQINIEGLNGNHLYISIFDLNGKTVIENITGNEINLGHLRDGIYFIKIQMDQEIIYRKFIKN